MDWEFTLTNSFINNDYQSLFALYLSLDNDDDKLLFQEIFCNMIEAARNNIIDSNIDKLIPTISDYLFRDTIHEDILDMFNTLICDNEFLLDKMCLHLQLLIHIPNKKEIYSCILRSKHFLNLQLVKLKNTHDKKITDIYLFEIISVIADINDDYYDIIRELICEHHNLTIFINILIELNRIKYHKSIITNINLINFGLIVAKLIFDMQDNYFNNITKDNIINYDISQIDDIYHKFFVIGCKTFDMLFGAIFDTINYYSKFNGNYESIRRYKEDHNKLKKYLSKYDVLLSVRNIFNLSLRVHKNIFSSDIIMELSDIAFNIIDYSDYVLDCDASNRDNNKKIITHIYDDYCYIIYGLNGRLSNPHIRYDILCNIINICTNHPIFNYKTYFPKNINASLFKYLNEVKFFTWLSTPIALRHYSNILKLLKICKNKNKLCVLHDENLYFEYSIDYITTAHTLLFYGSKVFDIAKEIFDELRLYNNILKNSHITVIRSLIDTITLSVKIFSQVALKEYLGSSYDDVSAKFNIFVNSLLMDLSKGSHVIYTICKIHDLPPLLLESIMDTYLNFAKNNMLIDIELNKDLVREQLEYVKMSKENKNIVLDAINKIGNDNDIDYPDEFIDPIFCVPIKNPVMLPHCEDIFDRTPIMIHLRNNPINPMTKEPLSIDDFIKYNNKDDIVERIKKFNNSLKKFIDDKKNTIIT